MYNIKAYLEDKGIIVTEDTKNVTRDWTNIQCPFPKCGDPSNHMGINPDGSGFSCWMCGESGKIYELIAVIENCSEKKAKKILRKYYDDSFSKQYTPIKHKDSRLITPKGLSKEFPKIAFNYLKERKFNPEYIIDKYNVFWGGYTEFFKYRIVFPITINKEIVTYVGRDVTKKALLKYKNWPNKFSSITVKNSIFNIDSITEKKIIIVEGIFDALRIGDNCIAMLGKTYTKKQIDLILSKKLQSVFIMLDSKEKDPEIDISVKKLKNSLSGYIKNIEILELDKGDPCDISFQEVINLKKDILL